jgi:activator of 2-hydroxyglutaryl-CoA dehydratase
MTDGSRKSSTELPQEPMIVGAVGAALFALDRARKTPARATT